jgi:hypothetical protein
MHTIEINVIVLKLSATSSIKQKTKAHFTTPKLIVLKEAILIVRIKFKDHHSTSLTANNRQEWMFQNSEA